MRTAQAIQLLAIVAVTALAGRASAWVQAPGAAPDEAAAADPPRPPANLSAEDHPWDGGEQIDLEWTLSPDDVELTPEQRLAGVERPVSHYLIQKSGEPTGPFIDVAPIVPGKREYKDGRQKFTFDKAERQEPYYFRVVAVAPGDVRSEAVLTSAPVIPTREPFDGGRLWLLIITVILCGSVVAFIRLARSGINLRVRKIAGLEAVDEAVGRATEMGRSVLFIPGIQDMNDIQTIAGITILSRVAKTAAEYDAKVEVPTARSLVMTAARETVQASYLSAGRPDAFNQNLIYYVTDEQFGYVAYLSGMMVREKPAACFYMGHFFAESLILAETGNSIGAIQVAGTAAPAQLPFFVAACDYTLIGEEFFAASAYLSGEPEQMGSLKGQDVGKVIVAVLLLLGCVMATVGILTGSDQLRDATEFLSDTMLQ